MKHSGGDVLKDIKKWTKDDPELRKAINRRKRKLKIGGLIKTARKFTGLSQIELSKKSSIPQAAIARIEGRASDVMPRIDLLEKLLDCMGFDLLIDFRIKK